MWLIIRQRFSLIFIKVEGLIYHLVKIAEVIHFSLNLFIIPKEGGLINLNESILGLKV
jgi:hypothetical protein